MTRTPGLGPRFAAWRILHDVRHGVPFDLVASPRPSGTWSPTTSGWPTSWRPGCSGSRSALDLALKPAIERGLASVRTDTLDVLRLGAYQLLHLDRVPVHAAVQTSVDVARRLGGRRVAGFVNAVLRRVADAAPRPEHLAAPADTAAALALAHSHPEWLVTRWLARFGPAATERLLDWNNRPPPLVLQQARRSRARLEAALAEGRIGARPAAFDAGLEVDATPSDRAARLPRGRFLGAGSGPGAGRPVRRSAAGPGDLRRVRRAGRQDTGTRPAGRPLHRRRGPPTESVRRLREEPGAGRTGPGCRPRGRCRPAPDSSGPRSRARRSLSRHRHPGAAPRRPLAGHPGALRASRQPGGRLLAAAADVVEPGGCYIYATCSLEPEENERQVDRFLKHAVASAGSPGPRPRPALLTTRG